MTPPLAQLAETVLVIIDAQNEYVDGAVPLPDVAPAATKVAALQAATRAAGGRVVHIVHKGAPGGLFDLEAPRGQIIDGLGPVGDEPVIAKPKPNAFADSPLADTLGAPGQSILVVGYMTHMCVSSTVRAALDLGYPATVASDACATRDLPGADGQVISAAALHAAELAALSDRFAAIATTDQILAEQV